PKEGEPSPPPPAGLTPKTAERYRELAEGQIIPHLGDILLQKLRPAKVAEWHATLLKAGSRRGKPLSARTVGHAHRLLTLALKRAVGTETIARKRRHRHQAAEGEEEGNRHPDVGPGGRHARQVRGTSALSHRCPRRGIGNAARGDRRPPTS